MRISRRGVVGGLALILPATAAANSPINPITRMLEIEHRYGGRLGVAAFDTATGHSLLGHFDERFLMCSTFKLLLVARVLQRVDAGSEPLNRWIAYGPADLLDWAPITREHVGEGGMTLSALCVAAIQHSDNTAANLLLRTVGGPDGVTRFARTLGDQSTRLDRNEPTLNVADGDKDTTTPFAMLQDMHRILIGDVLSAASRRRLNDWLKGNTTGPTLLRAGIPAGWTVGDKTGRGQGVVNDIAIATPPGRAPLLMAVFTSGAANADAAVAETARLIVECLS